MSTPLWFIECLSKYTLMHDKVNANKGQFPSGSQTCSIYVHTSGSFLYISHIEKRDPVCYIPSLFPEKEEVTNSHAHGNGV